MQGYSGYSHKASSYAILLGTIDEIQLIGEMQGINKTGLAMDKNKLKKRLIALAVKYLIR